jgi:hypothetical protein
MATSGTATFNMPFAELAEEAWERAGRELRTGYDLRTARRSMNLLTIEWANRGINLWTIDEGTIQLTKDDATYTLPADTIDVCEMNIRTNAGDASSQSDLSLNRISIPTYSAIPNKLSTGRPLQAVVHRLGQAGIYQSGDRTNGNTPTPTNIGANVSFLTLWPVPDSSTAYQISFYRMRRIQDMGSEAGKTDADMPFRFFPCAVAGLAYYIAMKVPELAPRIPMLKQEYEEQFKLASEEDREKTSARFVPSIGRC